MASDFTVEVNLSLKADGLGTFAARGSLGVGPGHPNLLDVSFQPPGYALPMSDSCTATVGLISGRSGIAITEVFCAAFSDGREPGPQLRGNGAMRFDYCDL